MRLFLRFLLCLSVLMVITSILIPMRYDVSYPKSLGPTLNNALRKQYQVEIVEQKANLVLIGDSILVSSVNATQLSQLSGEKVVSLGIPGSASAVWYLALKNIVATSPHKPRTVVITFRDTILTAPGYRVNGKYFSLVDELATTDDLILVDKAFIQLMNPIERWADRYLPLYGSRLRLRETLDYYIRYTLPGSTGCDQACNDDASVTVFQDLNLDANMLVEAIATAESYLYTPDQLDFNARIEGSFLPDMIDLANANEIQLILVRTKHLDDKTAQSTMIDAYISELKAYAAQNDVIVIDFADDQRLTSDLFADTHHLVPAGAELFTKMLYESIKPYIEP